MKPAQQKAIVAALVLGAGGIAGAGLTKISAAPSAQTVTLRDVRYLGNGAQVSLGVKSGAFGAGLVVRCLPSGPMVANKPAPAAVALCKAALAVPAATTSDLAALIQAK